MNATIFLNKVAKKVIDMLSYVCLMNLHERIYVTEMDKRELVSDVSLVLVPHLMEQDH